MPTVRAGRRRALGALPRDLKASSPKYGWFDGD
jgi:hypothetical protein